MIPKRIHYCWFGKNEKSENIKEMIKTWELYCPEYEIIEWNENNFSIEETNQYVKDAYKNKKWAFVSDYVRLYVLYNYGGIYLDTDVELLKNFDNFLENNMFMCVESQNTLCTAVIGSEKNNEILKKALNEYKNLEFIIDGKMNLRPNSEFLYELISNEKKIKIKDNIIYKLDNITIYSSDFFSAKNIHTHKLTKTSNTVSIHHLDASWYSKRRKFLRKIKKIILKIFH